MSKARKESSATKVVNIIEVCWRSSVNSRSRELYLSSEALEDLEEIEALEALEDISEASDSESSEASDSESDSEFESELDTDVAT